MKFSIITPSYNQLPYLRRCIASVADQTGVEVEHLVIDGGSADGSAGFLQECAGRRNHFSFISEPDQGMYDAINKGLDRISGDIVAWLNCDEQYLPDALNKTARFFARHSAVDFVCGDTLLVDPDGGLLSYRKNPPLRRAYILADHLYTQSASMFFRRKIFDAGFRFDSAWKAVGDCDFIARLLQAGFRTARIPDYLAACTMTGDNLSRQQSGIDELQLFCRRTPALYRLGRPVWNLLRYTEKFLRGGYRQAVPFGYSLYLDNLNERENKSVCRADFRFKWGPHE